MFIKGVDGHVGIGTTGPRTALDVVNGTNNTNADSSNVMNIVGPNQTGNSGNLAVTTNDAQAIDIGGSIAFGGRYINGGTGQAHFGRIKAGKENSTTAEYGGYLGFYTRVHGGTLTEHIRIAPNGDVGIGTATPGTTLDVYGMLTVRDADSSILIGNAGTNASKVYAGVGDELYFGGNNTYQLRFPSAGSAVYLRDTYAFNTETFTSAVVGGDGFKLSDAGNISSLEIDNITVRNTLRTHIFQKDVVKATNGILYVSDSAVVTATTGTTGAGTVTIRVDKSASLVASTTYWYKDANAATGVVTSVKFTCTNSTPTATGGTPGTADE